MIKRRRELFIAVRVASTDSDAVAGFRGGQEILVQTGCGQAAPLEVPFGMTEQQVLAEFVKGQLIALACLLAGMPLFLVLMLLS